MWSMEDALRLIDDLRSYNCLWDGSCMDYKNRNVKNEAFITLANRYAVTPSEVEKKVQSLKSQFRREYRKILEAELNGGAASRKQCNWFGYKPLLFLMNGMDDVKHEMNRSENVSMDGSEIKIENEDDYELQVTQSEDYEPEPEYNRDFPSPSPPPAKQRKLQTQTKLKKVPVDDEPTGAKSTQCMSKLIDVLTKRDEFSVYGEHIANKLRNCNRNHMEIAIAQHHMDNILYKLLIGDYSQGDGNKPGGAKTKQ